MDDCSCSDTQMLWNSLFGAFFLIGKKTLMLSPCLSVCLSVNQFSREPWDTQNQYFHHRSVYTSPRNYPNLVHFWQCVRIKFVKNHDKTLKNEPPWRFHFHYTAYIAYIYILRPCACIHCIVYMYRIAAIATQWGQQLNEYRSTSSSARHNKNFARIYAI